MPLNDQTPAVTLYDSSEVEVGTTSNPLVTKPGGTGTLTNGTETAVSSSAVQVLASNASRKAAIIQNTGTKTVRVGVSGVTATTGYQLAAGATIIFELPYVVTAAIFAIRESQDSTVLAMEIT